MKHSLCSYLKNDHLATELSACDQVGLYLLKRDALLMPSRPGNQDVLDVFPKSFVLLEVDHRRRFAASRIGDELNSGHKTTWPLYRRHALHPHHVSPGAKCAFATSGFNSMPDRKSTRLNSSHR